MKQLDKLDNFQREITTITFLCMLIASIIYPIHFGLFESKEWLLFIPIWVILTLLILSGIYNDEKYAIYALIIFSISQIVLGIILIITYSYIVPNSDGPFIDHSGEGVCTVMGVMLVITGVLVMIKAIKSSKKEDEESGSNP